LTAQPSATIFLPVTSADEAARSGALFLPRPDLETLVVTGPDRLEWLEAVLTCDVLGLASGGARWSLSLTKPGKMLADVLVVETGKVTYLGVPKTARERLHGFLAGFLVMEDADIAYAPELSWITVHGPRALVAARAALPAADGHAAAIELTGLGDAVLVVPSSHEEALRRAVSAWGTDAVLGGAADWERLRVERLVPAYGVDVTDATSPHEASLERRCISWEKGCYLGQEAVCMQEMRGKVKRRTVLIRLDSGAPPTFGTAVTDETGAPLGTTRTAVASAVHAHPIALAVLLAPSAVPGTRVRVAGEPASVVEPDR
jgi:folate-binding protein YgfZ